MHFKDFIMSWKTIIALAVAGLQAKAETLTVEYTLEGIEGVRHELQAEKDVQVLEFSGAPFTSISVPEGLTKLRELKIRGGNLLTNLSLSGGLTRLESLELMNCGLTDLSLPKGLVRLDFLFVYRNPLTILRLSENFGKEFGGINLLINYPCITKWRSFVFNGY